MGYPETVGLNLWVLSMQKLRDLMQQNSGATAIEYALIASGISLAIMVVVFALGDQAAGALTDVSDAIAAM